MRNSKKQRWIKLFMLEATTSGDRSFAAQHPLSQTIAAAMKAAAEGVTFGKQPKKDSKHHVRLVDIQLDETGEFVALLFREVDRDGQDTCYEDFESGDIEAHPKRPTQGNRYIAHLIVRLAGRHSPDGVQHRAAMEVVTGLSSSVIQQRLTGALRPYGSGSGKAAGEDIEYHTAYTLKAAADISILDELKAGVLESFVLAKPASPIKQGVDEEPLIQEQRSKLELKVVAKDPGNRLAGIWDRVRGRAKDGGYNEVTAYYHTDDGRHASTRIDVQKTEALMDLVQRVVRIDLTEDVNPDLKIVSWVVGNGMIAELKKLEAKQAKKA